MRGSRRPGVSDRTLPDPAPYPRPHPEVLRGSLEGALHLPLRSLEPSFETRLRLAPQDVGGFGRTVRHRRRCAAFLAALLIPLPALAADPIKLGLAAPLTGPDAGFGQGMRAGVEQAVAEINRAGGISGQKLQLTVLDDAGEPKQAASVAKKLVASGVKLVVGHLNSGASALALPVYDEAGIVAISPGATWAALTRRGASGFFRLCGSDAQQGALAGSYLADQFGDWPVAILNDKTAFGRGLADEASRALKAKGGREALFEGITRGEKDVSGLVAKLKAAKVEAVYFGGLSADAAMLVRAMRDSGIGAPLVASDGILDKDFAQLAGPGSEGTLMTLAPEPRKLPEPKGASRNAARPPEADAFAAPSYAAVEVLKQAIEGAKSTDPRKLAEFLHSGQTLRTAIGDIAFDARGDLAKPPYAMTVWRRTPDGRIDYAGNEVGR